MISRHRLRRSGALVAISFKFMRYLAIDLGDKRTGLALGDSDTRVVTPVEVIEVPRTSDGGRSLISALVKKAHLHIGPPSPGVALVLGLPLNMDGSEGGAAKSVRGFAADLTASMPYALHFHDERLTSVDADWTMARSGLTHSQKKARRDALAAAAILRDFLAAPNP